MQRLFISVFVLLIAFIAGPQHAQAARVTRLTALPSESHEPGQFLAPFIYDAPATPVYGQVTAPVVIIANGGRPEDYVGLNVTGKLVMVERGGQGYSTGIMTFWEKANFAADAGAAGIIVWNGFAPSGLGSGLFSIDQQTRIPAVMIDRTLRTAFVDLIDTAGPGGQLFELIDMEIEVPEPTRLATLAVGGLLLTRRRRR